MSVKYENLWQVTDGFRHRYVVAVAAMLATNIFIFSAPLIGKYAIDVITPDGGPDLALGIAPLAALAESLGGAEPVVWYLGLSAFVSVIATSLGGAFLYLRGRSAALASEGIVRRLREELYRRLHHLAASFYDDADTGDLVQRCSSDVETLRVFLASDVVEIGRSIMLLLTVMPIMFWLDVELALMSVVLMPFLGLGAYVFFSRVKLIFQQTDEAEAALTATLQENLTGIRVVRAFARQDYEIEKFAEKNRDFRDHYNRLIRLMGMYWGIADLFSMAQVGIVLFAGGYLAMRGELTIGTLFFFMTAEMMVIWPVRQLGRVLTDAGKAVVSLGRVNHILHAPEESEETTPPHGRADGEVVFEHVTFAYDTGTPVIRDLSVTMRPGESLAIVGPPGSGKSTLIRLLLRLYEHQQGTIRLDGHDIATVNRQWLRAQVGVVMQDPFLYSRSIAANLGIGRPDAPAEHVEQACEDAAILDSIATFPERFDAMVGERGVTLSGGQRQRLALARALLKDPPVLVLDDSLSAVDTGTEQQILKALARRGGRHTTIVIAHRLSSVMHADRIMVLDGGRCVQLGDHETLLAEEGPYRRLCRIQGNLDAEIADDVQATQRSKQLN